MWQRVYGFLVVLVLMFCKRGSLEAQNTNLPLNANNEWLKKLAIIENSTKHNPENNTVQLSEPEFKETIIGGADKNYRQVTRGVYHPSLGFFCKKELQLDKFTPLQFRFRLGSLEYTNWMEGKPNALPGR